MPHKEIILTIQNTKGLHARAAAKFAKIVNVNDVTVTVQRMDHYPLEKECDSAIVSGTSLLGLMLLAAEKGTKLRVHAEGRDAQKVIHELKKLVASQFEETS